MIFDASLAHDDDTVGTDIALAFTWDAAVVSAL